MADAQPADTADKAPDELRALWAELLSRQRALSEASDSERKELVSKSWTAKLLDRGVEKCAQKVGEEATECVIEAVLRRKEGLVKESADLLYHLMVTWVASGVTPDEVLAELSRRQGTSGIAEKASRPAS
mmetsp:Transcript_44506/g.96817  ORF Transcript_44506/g.96817 Transcript_44506/m.96817 type:complete len:130 (+) Transcript_44506:56-445(+)|eukprot:CAMPEP_0170620936 /NCGR_PEP_ID=MMETSP0224-20130122/28332_1 /TAXON_ID=285029 /ORGANISM="Togula jolla, Strain CCCM 725" /LENGTH=129 /DNA_ID=CAMNT_0010947159 /DNA_START=39 /DNA_END=428 /DNA_ORIENTATION=-